MDTAAVQGPGGPGSIGSLSPTTRTAYAVEGGDYPQSHRSMSPRTSMKSPARLHARLPSYKGSPSQWGDSPVGTPASEDIKCLSLTEAEAERRTSSLISSPESQTFPIPRVGEPIEAGEVLRESNATEMQPIPIVDMANAEEMPLETLVQAADNIVATNGQTSTLSDTGDRQGRSQLSSRRQSTDLETAVPSVSSHTSGNTDYHLARTPSVSSSLGGRRSSLATQAVVDQESAVETLAQPSSATQSSHPPLSPSSPRYSTSQTRSTRGESSMTGGRSGTDYSTSSIGHSRRLSNDSNTPLAIGSSISARPSHAGHDGSQSHVPQPVQTSTMRRNPSASKMQRSPSRDQLRAGSSRERTSTPTAGTSAEQGLQQQPEAGSSSQRERAEKERVASSSRRQLGEWTLGKTLGAGSMGKVKLGVSSITGEKVCQSLSAQEP